MSVLSLLLFFLFDAYNGFTVIALFILLYMFFVCVCLVNCPCLCALLFVWSFGNLGTACVYWADALPTRVFGSPS